MQKGNKVRIVLSLQKEPSQIVFLPCFMTTKSALNCLDIIESWHMYPAFPSDDKTLT